MKRCALTVFLLWSTLACGRVHSGPDARANAAAGGSNETEQTSPAQDPTVTARYRWSECARIEPRSAPWDERYARDGSVLVLDKRGRLIDYSADGDAPTFLLQAD